MRKPLCLLYYSRIHANSGSYGVLECQLSKRFEVRRFTAKQVLDNAFPHRSELFVMPGGRDIPYQEELHKGFNSSGKICFGNQNLQKHIYNGCNYIGICAGAYYACSRVLFDLNGPLQVKQDRDLHFYQGNAVGPVYPGFKYNSASGLYRPLIRWADGTVSMEYFNGGCTFSGSDCEVLAEYGDNHKPAIIRCQVGKGAAILSGIHPEHNPATLERLLNFFFTI
jgi:biotin--protein ligase